MFSNNRDGKMRLQHTIIMYNNNPVYVLDVRGDSKFQLYIKYLSNGREEVIRFEDPLFDFTPVPLGNTNYEGEVYYCMRVPGRKYKQGLHRESFKAFHYNNGYLNINLQTRALAKTIKGQYPSLKKAFENTQDGIMRSCAFSRHFSLFPNLNIYYNNRIYIGKIKEDLKKFSLKKDKFFFEEHLKESLK